MTEEDDTSKQALRQWASEILETNRRLGAPIGPAYEATVQLVEAIAIAAYHGAGPAELAAQVQFGGVWGPRGHGARLGPSLVAMRAIVEEYAEQYHEAAPADRPMVAVRLQSALAFGVDRAFWGKAPPPLSKEESEELVRRLKDSSAEEIKAELTKGCFGLPEIEAELARYSPTNRRTGVGSAEIAAALNRLAGYPLDGPRVQIERLEAQILKARAELTGTKLDAELKKLSEELESALRSDAKRFVDAARQK